MDQLEAAMASISKYTIDFLFRFSSNNALRRDFLPLVLLLSFSTMSFFVAMFSSFVEIFSKLTYLQALESLMNHMVFYLFSSLL